ncbi:MAG: RNA-directed DNA polymerase [Bacteroidales bacterium]|nr:RNA-directed DNA polymerase [Bacteroidales bacterium]
MKRYGNLYERIISVENLMLADQKARKGKSQRSIRQFDKDREGNLLRLHESLRDGTFKTSEYIKFKVYEPKEREIYRLPYYPDRIVHHAIMNVLEEIWMRTFTYNTYSCIKGRGIEACARQVSRIIGEYSHAEHLYCLKIDIHKFYPSVDNEIMKQIVRKKIKDKRLLSLLDGIIDSERGLPIGNYLSQFLSNLYLSYMMHYINEHLKVKATEYADDICFFSDNKKKLHEVLTAVSRYINTSLKLELKPNYQIFPISDNRADRHGRALDYVGYKFYRHQRLMRKSIKKNLCRKVAKLRKRNTTPEALRKQIAPWLGWAKHSNSKNLLNKLGL